MSTESNLSALSQWIDDGNDGRDQEAITWGRLAKVSEECGEVIAAFIGWTGQNPRKGKTHSENDVIEELLDVAVTALGAVEHMHGNRGVSVRLLDRKVAHVVQRAGLDVPAEDAVAEWGCDYNDGNEPWISRHEEDPEWHATKTVERWNLHREDQPEATLVRREVRTTPWTPTTPSPVASATDTTGADA